ncbi:MAG: D-alanyl-D-alanine carboxypeptidase/D-alanyl-D-alanine endopeptidase, partial [Enterovibrio sp.]
KELKALLGKLKPRGISKIEGNIWLDDSIFSGYDLAVGLPWDILGVCYSAPTSAITLEGNCVHATLYNMAEGNKTRLYVPSHQPITTSSNVKALSKAQQQEANCDLQLSANNKNHYELTGCITKQEGPFPLKFAVQNPSKYVAAVTKQLLSELGIGFNGKVQVMPAGRKHQGTLIASHFSAKRDALLSTMLKDSDNLIADNLLKIMGHRYYRQPGSFINGTKALKLILKEKANIDLTSAVLVDGSGLSRNNLMTAGQLAQIMQWIYKNKRQELLAILPVSGIDGTLKFRPSLRNAPIKGKLQAKSGAIFGSYNLVGVLQRADRDLIVVQLVSHYHYPDEDKVQDKAQQPIFAFERALYQSLLQQKLPVK